MADGPSHYVVLKKDGVEARRLGPTHLGRAYRVKANLEHRLEEGETLEIVDNDALDPATGKEKSDADTDSTSRGDLGDR